MNIITVGDLIQKLSFFPDDMDVILWVTINNSDIVHERSIKSLEIKKYRTKPYGNDDFEDVFVLEIISGKDTGIRYKVKELTGMLSVANENTYVFVNFKNIEDVDFGNDRNKKQCCAFEVW